MRSQTMVAKREQEEHIDEESFTGNLAAKSGTIYSKKSEAAFNIFERFRIDLSEKNKELEEVKTGSNP